MKAKAILLGCLISIFIFSAFYKSSLAVSKIKEEPGVTSKVGIVCVRKIFQNCKKNEKYKEQAKAEQDKAIGELQQLRAEIKAAEANLETRKSGTKEYLDLAQELAQKKAMLPIKQDYYEQQFAAKDKDWTEQLYKDVLKYVGEAAKEKGLDLVFEKDVPEFPFSRADELMLVVRTNKVLYSSGCTDITDDVMNRIDTAQN